MVKLTSKQMIGDNHEKKVRKDFEKEYKEYLKLLNNREESGLKPISFDDYLWDRAEKKEHKMFPVNPKRLDKILKKIGRR